MPQATIHVPPRPYQAWIENGLHFTSGQMSGTVAAVRQDVKGHRFLHIDSTVMNAPAGDPKFGDHICIEK